MKIFRTLYDKMLQWTHGPHAERALFAVSFIESSIFPIPPDVMLVPMCLANRARAIRYATICTAASVLGGLFGYAIGYFLFESIGHWIIDIYGMQHAFDTFAERFNEWGWWLVLMAGFTPFPYKVITITSGLFALNLPVFMAASVISRGGRFYLEAFLLYHYGAPIRRFIDHYFGWLTLAFFALLIGGFMAVKFWM